MNTRHHLAVCLSAILNSGMTSRKHKNVNNVAPNRPQKGHLLAEREPTQRRQSAACFDLRGERVWRKTQFWVFSPALHLAVNDCQSATSIDCGVINTFQQVGEFAYVESVTNRG